MKKVLMIIPAYNEEGNIEKTVNSIIAYREANYLSFQLDYLVVNDGSKDSTPRILDQLQFNHVDLVQNLGIGGCVQTGYIYASRNGYDIAVQFDGDGQHDIASINDVISPILKGEADFTIGSRFVTKTNGNFQSTVARRMGINLISKAIKLMTGRKIYDTTSGYRAASGPVIDYLSRHYPVSYPEPESIVRIIKKGYRVKEVHANMFERLEGTSSIRAFKVVTYMLDVLLSIFIAGLMKERD